VTPQFRFVLARRPLLPSHLRLNRRGMAPRLFVASAGRKVQWQDQGHWYPDRPGGSDIMAPRPARPGRMLLSRHSGRSTIETIQDVRLKQFCASKPHGLSKPVNPREAKTSRWSVPRQRLSFLPAEARKTLTLASLWQKRRGKSASAALLFATYWLCRASRDGSDTSNPAWLSLVSRSPQRAGEASHHSPIFARSRARSPFCGGGAGGR
jgi:hypothetical protein